MKHVSPKDDDPAAVINRQLAPDDERLLWANSPWIAVLEKAEQGNTQPLIELLLTKTPLPSFARECIAHLLSRRKLLRKRGGQRSPLYRITEVEAKLQLAAMDVRSRKAIWGYDDALNSAANDWEVSPDVLDNYMKDKRGSSRRKRAR